MTQKSLLAVALLVSPLTSMATIQVTDNFSISGFGSTSITKSDNSAPLFVNREITDNTCYDCDTIFGLQADLSIIDDLKASVQVVKRPQDHWSSPELEWAYLNYEFSQFSVRAGKLRIPLFLVSEYFYVGQAYPWARPPQEVYDSILGFTSFEGASASWLWEFNDETVVRFSPFYGLENDSTLNISGRRLTFKSDYMVGLSAEVSGFNYRVHFGYMNSKYIVSPRPNSDKETLNIYTLGGEYSMDDWLFMSEVQTDDVQTNWYVSAAYNINKFTPYLVYGESHDRRKTNSVTAGVRYDLTHTVSLNAEWQGIYMNRKDYNDGNSGQFISPPILYNEDKDAQLYTLMLNFIF
ncbi:porin [Photobacterium sp. ZSDE20]|uniref:Porin n=1 Tax=Photobacterium pectinilyticum TaxID=2906793 RepID=A0ABT1N3A5_9GAMM|nr:porin [Photobacterium sp. ZSDE20]MCQ1059233.1 porin [Photobacterium sp. ZSDE20]MDD1824534.1 porin [Photobacterium sp. ZSDE20]